MANSQKIPVLKDKAAMFGKGLKISNMHERDGEGEEGGDAGALVPGHHVLLSKIIVARKVASRIIGNDLIYDAIFDKGKKPVEPDSNLNIQVLRIGANYKGCSVTITFGVSKKSVELTNARVKDIWLKPVTGGVFEMRCNVQGIPVANAETVLALQQQFGKEVTVSIKWGDLDEQDSDEDDKQLDMVSQQQREKAGEDDEETVVPATGGNGRPGVGATH